MFNRQKEVLDIYNTAQAFIDQLKQANVVTSTKVGETIEYYRQLITALTQSEEEYNAQLEKTREMILVLTAHEKELIENIQSIQTLRKNVQQTLGIPEVEEAIAELLEVPE